MGKEDYERINRSIKRRKSLILTVTEKHVKKEWRRNWRNKKKRQVKRERYGERRYSMSKGLFWLMFYSLFICPLVNTALATILFEHTSYFK